MSIDFITYQLQHIEEREIHQIPGVLVEHASRTAHRHRKRDILSLFLSFTEDQHYSNEEINSLIKEASGIFFHSKGSVTKAIRTIIEYMNKKILERNLEYSNEGVQAEGSVNILVLHNNQLFLGQVGNAQTYIIGPSRFERLGEDGKQTDKLGCTKRVQPRLSQNEMHVGDLILMSPHAYKSWTAYYLSGSNELLIEQIGRRLHNQLIQDFSVLIIKTVEGNGKVREGVWEPEEIQIPVSKDSLIDPGIKGSVLAEIKGKNSPLIIDSDKTLHGKISAIEKQECKMPEEADRVNRDIKISLGETENVVKGETETPFTRDKDRKKENGLTLGIARLWMKGKTFHAKWQLFWGKISRRIFTNRVKNTSEESSTFLLAIVLAVPIIIIFLSLSTYTRFGKEEQFRSFIDEAQKITLLAEGEEDAIKQKEYWEEVLDLSMKAEKYLITNESRQLFQTAQGAIDTMELTERLNFHPALTNYFPEEVIISRIKGGASGIYLLDVNSGNVLRIFLNTKGFYELDEEFKCAPGPYGLVTVTKLIDFIILPANSENYKIMALDGQGNLLYCQPGESPVSRTLTIPPGGWDRIIGVAYANDSLYVVDAGRSSVWIYKGNSSSTSGLSGIIFTESPVPFFDEEAPDLGGAIDASINQDDLYILHEDGHMTLCQYSSLKDVKLTECEDPAPFTDIRISSENKKPWIFMGTHFTGMWQTKLPNSSLYILDDVSSMFYQFSLQLNLERTLKPQINRNYPIPMKKPSGFGITPDQEISLAYDNQLFTAPLQ
ncbi:MAG: hypothetical protein J7L66_03490 [Anaerolineaceae bacterium]|nr:hypothetical protein [Anaerolineaceae bacterium]